MHRQYPMDILNVIAYIHEDYPECIRLLEKWELGQYVDMLIHDGGYDDTQQWDALTVEELTDLGMKIGHARKLIRKAKDYRPENKYD